MNKVQKQQIKEITKEEYEAINVAMKALFEMEKHYRENYDDFGADACRKSRKVIDGLLKKAFSRK